ncbi:hypothetical protein GG344DRAFT_45767, partial [Lentinula edodes]
MDTSSGKFRSGLPGIVSLYIGMPVILKHENLNTELGITNGARGILRKLELCTDNNGHQFCEYALVEFPDSKAQLSNLPQGYFPIKARSWRFSTYIWNEKNEKVLVSVVRKQLPFEPLFALTGQGAQGRTLFAILCMLHLGGYGAYV